MDIHEMVKKIESREDLIEFLEALMVDVRENRAEWNGNDKLDYFLDGVSGWLANLDGWCENRNIPVPEQPTWQLVGQMFMAGKYFS